ncbi:N,N-dimethylformamidase beta subunit family domain-containing protein [Bordetella sp. N]|uniref:N,N-dimethylformamidase beta subunit family domain-containing protein n=1 Tax=Bordetella sp. N TaxID=1746199 RepID=UPI00070CDB60|nr:N,N-dimethylformamidase beta subunit family domain-containing protein [Bordetella sp. N]ALM85662.1 N,N-dimethylformamidase large subunit [Bordetella sp. N]
MKPAVSQPPIIGYVTPLSAAPGQDLSFRISSTGDQPFSARVLRIHCADPNPAGPGMQLEPVDVALEPRYAGREHAVHSGACAWAALQGASTGIAADAVLTLRVRTRPTLVSDPLQVLASLQDATASSGVALAIDKGEFVVLLPGADLATARVLRSGVAATQDRWQAVSLTLAPRQGHLTLAVENVAVGTPGAGPVLPTRTATLDAGAAMAAPTHLSLGALWRGHPALGYNGLIEAPQLLVRKADGTDTVMTEWHLARDMHAQRIPGLRPDMPALVLENMPVRAVRSSAWTGDQLDWRQAPDEYAAIWFHADALADCGWPEALSLRIPPGLPSGVYGLEIRNADGIDTIPFYVTPAKDGPRAKVLFLASTLTYQAYANHARGNYAGELADRITAWDAYPNHPDNVTQFGASTYNRYRDSAGISLSSRLRPILTMRPGYLTFPDPRGSGLRHFPADSHLTSWLKDRGIAYDVITDEDLDDQGLAALAPYDVVLTGSHPEYHTRGMIEALIAYRENGGHLMYFGANGFYWKVARPAAAPHMLEIRRAEGGIRAWAAEPGEYYHQFDGRYGGMWRRNGIPPQVTGGVGFAVQGGFEGVGYKRTPESHDADVAWLFEGVKADSFGDHGLSGGGAAGFELDQVVPELGSPAWLKIVAVSDGHGPSFKIVPEEILTWTIAAALPRKYEGVRAHMAVGLAETGGGIFAAGSITFLGSLWKGGYDNDISRIVENCLRRFLSASDARRARE